MSELMRESLSALLDDEANELEIERVLSKVADDPELRATWVRYNIVHTVAGRLGFQAALAQAAVECRRGGLGNGGGRLWRTAVGAAGKR